MADFAAGYDRWIAGLGGMCDVVRQELVARQLAERLDQCEPANFAKPRLDPVIDRTHVLGLYAVAAIVPEHSTAVAVVPRAVSACTSMVSLALSVSGTSKRRLLRGALAPLHLSWFTGCAVSITTVPVPSPEASVTLTCSVRSCICTSASSCPCPRSRWQTALPMASNVAAGHLVGFTPKWASPMCVPSGLTVARSFWSTATSHCSLSRVIFPLPSAPVVASAVNGVSNPSAFAVARNRTPASG